MGFRGSYNIQLTLFWNSSGCWERGFLKRKGAGGYNRGSSKGASPKSHKNFPKVQPAVNFAPRGGPGLLHEDGDDTRDRASEGPTDPHQSTTDTSKINNNMGNSNGYGIGSSTIVVAEANCKLGTGLPL